jgi:hypothetical protein
MGLPNPQDHAILAMLSLPRSLDEVTRQVASDPNAPFEVTASDLADQIAAILTTLGGQDYARNVGTHETPEAVLSFLADDDSLVAMPAEKGEQYTERTNNRDAYKIREGNLWYWTVAGRDALLN